MWRKLLKVAIQAAVAAGLPGKIKNKVVGWLKGKFDSAAEENEVSLKHDREVVRKVIR